MMKKIFIPLAIVLASCGGGKKSAEEIAKEWCELHKKSRESENEIERDKAKEEMKEFERVFHEEYGNDEAMTEKVGELTDECFEEGEGHHDYDGD